MRILLIFILFGMTLLAYGQEKDVEIVVNLKDDNSGKKLAGATVSVYANGKLVSESISAGNGKVPTIYVPTGEYYQIFIRKTGYVTKMAELDARIDIIEDAPDPLYLRFETSIFESIEGVDFQFLEKTPMTKFDFDSMYEYRFDKEYTAEMLKRIESLKRQIEEKRKEEEKQEKEALKTEADFQAYVDAGNKAVKETRYEIAVEQYGLALELRKDNAEVKAKLADAKKLWDQQKKDEENQKKYEAKMSEAAKAYKGEALEEAINLYNLASALKPKEKEPIAKIEEIRLKIAEQKALDKKIESLVSAGDIAVKAEGFDEAIDKYTEALGLRESDEVKSKLEATKKQKEDFLAAEEAKKLKQEQYNALLESGKVLFADEKYEDAKAKYLEASSLFPDEQIPKDKILQIDKLIAEAKAKQENILAYNNKMKEAKAALDTEKLESALTLYTEASEMMPLEQDPKTRIDEINDLLEKQKASNEQYLKFLKEGDQFASTEEYEAAIDLYEKARGINNTDEVGEKISVALEAMAAISEKKRLARELEAKYTAAIEKANKEKNDGQLEQAIASYTEALTLKEDETYPVEEIKKLNQLIEERKAEEAAKLEAEAAYQAIIEAGDKLLVEEKYEEAKLKFAEANSVKSEDPYPIEKLKEIESKLSELANRAEREKQYVIAINSAKEAFGNKAYDQAIADYSKAKEIKPDEAEPQEKIDEINKILLDLKNEAEKVAAYEAAMTAGNDLRDTKDYNKAKESYKLALTFMTEDPVALKEIENIDKLLESLADAKAKEEQFNNLVAEADNLFDSKDYLDAKIKYNEALEIRSDDKVMQKVKMCDDKLKELDAVALERERATALVAEGDELIKTKSWTEAIAKYEMANSIEPTDYNTAQIKMANDNISLEAEDKVKEDKRIALLGEAKDFEAAKEYKKALNTYKAAYELRPTPEIEETIKTVESEIKAIESKMLTNKAYDNKIEQANNAYSANKYQEAIELYTEAKVLKAEQEYPNQQIKLCEEAIAKLNEAENIEKYNGIVAKADQFFSSKDFDKAITQYELAKQVMSKKTYPDEKIAEIEKLRKDIADAEAAKIKKANEYKDLVSRGDEQLSTQNYEEALSSYKKAQKLQAYDAYVEGQIKSAKEKLTALNAAKAATQKYQSFVDIGDKMMKEEKWKLAIEAYNSAQIYDRAKSYPKDQIKLAEQAIENDSKQLSESAYKALLSDAQAKMDDKDYENALTLFKTAYRQRPEDDLPANKIGELNALITAQNAVASSEDKYKKLIKKADQSLKNKEYKSALYDYKKAYAIANDDYSDGQIKKIDAIINTFAGDQYSKMIKKADEYFRNENYEKAKGLYNRAIKTFTTQNTSYPKAQIKKIKSIQNPPALLAGGTAKPVGEKVNLSESEIQKMFEEADEASKNKEETKVLNAGASAKNVINDWSVAETNASYQAVDSLEYQKAQISNQRNKADLARQNEEVLVNNVSKNVAEQNTYEREYGENVSFRQMQVVTNIERTNANADLLRDDERQDFVPKVEVMTQEYKAEKILQNGTQNNMLFTQVNQIETMNEELTDKFTNADVARSNTELDVKNAQVNIKNQTNKNIWEHEDVVFSTLKAKETMDAEKYSAAEFSDIPRQNMEQIVNSSGNEFVDSQRASAQSNEVVTSQTNSAVKMLRENISEASKEADAGRENMEKVNNRMSENLQQTTINRSQLNQTQVELTDQAITELNSDQNKTHQNKTDKLYKDIETINDNIDDVEKRKMSDLAVSENNMYLATDKVAEANKKLDKNSILADQKAESSTDEIILQQDMRDKEQRDTDAANEQILNNTEDQIKSLRDIDVKAITQAVKNELGSKYPEGVTEEVYQQKDEDGYLLSYVIRRVVVKDGEGNVYEKTQMKHGTSYTKNGVAISEFTWQERTEDANLSYH